MHVKCIAALEPYVLTVTDGAVLETLKPMPSLHLVFMRFSHSCEKRLVASRLSGRMELVFHWTDFSF
jgi:hypothetical protein